MRVLVVEIHFESGCLWERALQRSGADVCFARSQSEAVKALMQDEFDIIVLDLVLKNGSAFAISDFANYRRPKARVVFVTNTSFFSDGSIFQHCSNACAYLQS
ncbi:response regulator [Rhodobacteraceae bacterium IMCC15231]|nr:response regulator [Rhodobacteraceae bacterium IMCC15231]